MYSQTDVGPHAEERIGARLKKLEVENHNEKQLS